MRFSKKICLVWGMLLPMTAVAAWRFRVTQLPNQRQLPVANVHRILQDREGYMWYATEGGGLCRDDGYRIEVFRSDKHRPSLLADNNITCLAEDRQGSIWFGTPKGLHRLDKADYRIHRLEDAGVKDKPVTCLLAASDGTVWVAVRDTILCYRPCAVESSEKDRGKPAPEVWEQRCYPSLWKGKPCGVSNFFQDGAGNVMALQGRGGLLVYRSGSDDWAEGQWPFGIGPNFFAEGSRTGVYWAATWGRGIVKYRRAERNRPATVVPQPVTHDLDEPGGFRSQVLNILYDRRRRLLWAAAMDDLYAYRTDGDTLVPYPTETFLPKGKKILDNVVLDRDGNLWVPGYSPHTFIVHAADARLRRDSVGAMSEATGYRVMVDRVARENDSLYWIWQGRTGLSLYNARDNRMTFARAAAHPAPLSVAKCLEKRQTAPGIWTCGGSRLFRVWHRGMAIEWAEETAARVEGTIRVLRDAGKGRLYIGTADGLYRYDYDRHVIRRLAASVGAVRDIVISPDETVYFVSDKKGFCKLDSANGQAVALAVCSADGNRLNGFSALAAAPDGTVWAATSRGNVCRYVPADGRCVDDETAGNRNGDAVKALVADEQGHIWILSDSYLKVYNPVDGAVRFFHSSDAAIDMDYFHTLALEGDSVCLGGIGAFCMIAASDVFAGESLPPVATLLKIDNETCFPDAGGRTLRLPYEVSRVEVFVSTFDHLYADSIRFAWRLDARDEWTELAPGDNRIVLERLPRGTAVLEVRATDRFGHWQEPVECLVVTRPFMGRSWGVCLALLLLVGGGLYGAVRRRRRRQSAAAVVGAGSAEAVVPASGGELLAAPALNGGEAVPVSAADEGRRTPAPYPDDAVPKSEAPVDDGPVRPVLPSKADEDFLRRAAETVEKNLDNADYSVEQFSADMCMSRMNLYRKLQTLTAQKPSEFVRDIRLQRAAELLRNADLSLAEVVDRVGFGTPRYFSKCFKEKYGLSPSQYRVEHTDTVE